MSAFAVAPRYWLAVCATALLAISLLGVTPDGYVAAQTAQKGPKASGADKAVAATSKGEQSIVVLVNDEPVTGYQIEQRAKFIAASSGGGIRGPELKAKAEARWAQILQDPNISARFQQLLEAAKGPFRRKNPATTL